MAVVLIFGCGGRRHPYQRICLPEKEEAVAKNIVCRRQVELGLTRVSGSRDVTWGVGAWTVSHTR